MAYDYTNFLKLLEDESYPARYLHKFIGKSTPEFLASVEKLEVDFPRATQLGRRESVSKTGGAPAYVAYTYELLAESAEEIVEFVRYTSTMSDVKIIL